MTVGFQVTFDAHEPARLAEFWKTVLGYVEQEPPPGFKDADDYVMSLGFPADWRDRFYAVVDPEGRLPRLYFQAVPEGKSVKNRVHLDVNVGAGLSGAERRAAVRRRADELAELGATELREAVEHGEYWITLADPEGNEFCVQ